MLSKLPARQRQARKWARMTQARLADIVTVHPNTISDIERGHNFPGLTLGIKIAKALRVHIWWYVGMIDNPRQGIQIETDEEWQNWQDYLAMAPEEKRELIRFMTDLHRARKIGKGEFPREKAKA